MQPNLSTKDLRVVVALSQTRNFGQAALQVHLSPSALSALVARIEAQVGARLFERTTRAVELTEAGQVFLEHAQELLRGTYAALGAVHDVVHLRRGSVTIAALPSLAASVVPQVFARFAAQHPLIKLSLLDALSGPAFDLVRDGKADFALTAADPQQEDLSYEQLTTDEFLLLCARDHALCARPGPVTLEDSLEFPHVSMPASASVRQYLEADLLCKGIRFNPAFEVDHIATIGALVGAGLGISALPQAAAALLRQDALVRLALAPPSIRRPLGAVSRRYAPLSPAAASMYAMLAQRMRETGRAVLPCGW